MNGERRTRPRRIPDAFTSSTILAVLSGAVIFGCGWRPASQDRQRVDGEPPATDDTSPFAIFSPEWIGPLPAATVAEMEPCPAPQGSWPWWRGPQSSGVSPDRNAPTRWSETDNIVWKAEVPGRGHSSPIVWGDRVFVTAANEAARTQGVLCYARATGQLLWQTTVHQGGLMSAHQVNSHASATPACDGRRVLATFLNRKALWVTVLDMEGNVLWQTEAGPFYSVHGGGPSPAVYGPYVFVNGDNALAGFLAALDRETGQVVWRVPREHCYYGNYATPVVARLAEKPQLLLTGLGKTASYDPATGRSLWSCRGPAKQTANSVVFNDPYVFACGGDPDLLFLCVRADGEGDVSHTHMVWQSAKAVPNVSSPLFYRGRIYAATDHGILTCRDAMTGDVLWRERLRGHLFASPVAVGDHVYLSATSGITYVFKDAATLEMVSENQLDGPICATPAVSAGRLFIRTAGSLYCIGNGESENPFPSPSPTREMAVP